MKYVLLMVLCSELAGNQCKVIPTPTILFNDYSSCIVSQSRSYVDAEVGGIIQEY